MIKPTIAFQVQPKGDSFLAQNQTHPSLRQAAPLSHNSTTSSTQAPVDKEMIHESTKEYLKNYQPSVNQNLESINNDNISSDPLLFYTEEEDLGASVSMGEEISQEIGATDVTLKKEMPVVTQGVLRTPYAPVTRFHEAIKPAQESAISTVAVAKTTSAASMPVSSFDLLADALSATMPHQEAEVIPLAMRQPISEARPSFEVDPLEILQKEEVPVVATPASQPMVTASFDTLEPRETILSFMPQVETENTGPLVSINPALISPSEVVAVPLEAQEQIPSLQNEEESTLPLSKSEASRLLAQGEGTSPLVSKTTSAIASEKISGVNAPTNSGSTLSAPVASAVRTARFSDFLNELTATVSQARLNSPDGNDITFQLRSDVLEATTIHISSSASRMEVAFSTMSSASNNMLNANLNTLQNHLTNICPGQVIDVKNQLVASSTLSQFDHTDQRGHEDLASFNQRNRGNSRNNDDAL